MNKIYVAILYIATMSCVGYFFYILTKYTGIFEVFNFLIIMKLLNYSLWFLWVNIITVYLLFYAGKGDNNA